MEVFQSLVSAAGSIARSGDLPLLAVTVSVAANLTLVFMAIVGRRIASRSRAAAVAAGGMFTPVLAIMAGYGLAATAPVGAPPNDAPAMLATGMMVAAILCLPIGLATSVAYIAWRDRRRGGTSSFQ